MLKDKDFTFKFLSFKMQFQTKFGVGWTNALKKIIVYRFHDIWLWFLHVFCFCLNFSIVKVCEVLLCDNSVAIIQMNTTTTIPETKSHKLVGNKNN